MNSLNGTNEKTKQNIFVGWSNQTKNMSQFSTNKDATNHFSKNTFSSNNHENMVNDINTFGNNGFNSHKNPNGFGFNNFGEKSGFADNSFRKKTGNASNVGLGSKLSMKKNDFGFMGNKPTVNPLGFGVNGFNKNTGNASSAGNHNIGANNGFGNTKSGFFNNRFGNSSEYGSGFNSFGKNTGNASNVGLGSNLSMKKNDFGFMGNKPTVNGFNKNTGNASSWTGKNSTNINFINKSEFARNAGLSNLSMKNDGFMSNTNENGFGLKSFGKNTGNVSNIGLGMNTNDGFLSKKQASGLSTNGFNQSGSTAFGVNGFSSCNKENAIGRNSASKPGLTNGFMDSQFSSFNCKSELNIGNNKSKYTSNFMNSTMTSGNTSVPNVSTKINGFNSFNDASVNGMGNISNVGSMNMQPNLSMNQTEKGNNLGNNSFQFTGLGNTAKLSQENRFLTGLSTDNNPNTYLNTYTNQLLSEEKISGATKDDNPYQELPQFKVSVQENQQPTNTMASVQRYTKQRSMRSYHQKKSIMIKKERTQPKKAETTTYFVPRKSFQNDEDSALFHKAKRDQFRRSKSFHYDEKLLGNTFKLSPTREEISKMSEEQLMAIDDFTVEKPGVGSIRFLEPVNILNIDLEKIIKFEKCSVEIYPDTIPNVGTGLNKKIRITLKNCTTKARNVEKSFKRKTSRFGGKLIEYDQNNGTWVFEIDHL
eukprot:TRINITY_DN1459_c0_g1_i1.p1 TRINITY_DN1459_c0_g1~~TRINITY_DN1459_c0_g1_i1.p1  ORF type:complete len:704 (-),score=163.91 TRINITY_DN1459_c0_g1_i1:11-2122(-)